MTIPGEEEEEAIKTEEETKAEAEYEKAFNEDPDEKPKEGELLAEVDPPPEAKVDKDAKEKPEDVKPAEDVKHHGDIESMNKALNDTKTHMQDLGEQLKNANAAIKALSDGKGSEKEAADAKANFEAAQKDLDVKLETMYADYPEQKEAIDAMVGIMRSQATTIEDLQGKVNKVSESTAKTKEEEDKAESLRLFEETVLPEVVKDHEDALAMIKDPRYATWAYDIEKTQPMLSKAALDSNAPGDISMALTEFKKFLATPEAGKMANEQDKLKDKTISNAQTLRGSSQSMPDLKKKDDKNDYLAGWEESDKLLENVN